MDSIRSFFLNVCGFQVLARLTSPFISYILIAVNLINLCHKTNKYMIQNYLSEGDVSIEQSIMQILKIEQKRGVYQGGTNLIQLKNSRHMFL